MNTSKQENLISNAAEIPLSSEVKVGEPFIYVLRIDTTEVKKGKDTGEICYVDSEDVASHSLESLANEEIRRLEKVNPGARIFRENMINPSPYKKRIDIHKRTDGFFANTHEKVASFGYVAIPFATFTDTLLV